MRLFQIKVLHAFILNHALEFNNAYKTIVWKKNFIINILQYEKKLSLIYKKNLFKLE